MLHAEAPERKGRALVSLFASMDHLVRASRRLAVAAGLLLATAGGLAAQPLEPAGTGGLAALDRDLRALDQNKRVLVIGAHPDDDNTELITFLERGTGADVAYLSLSRGEGGQNFIGPELGDALGLLRSEELLSSRAVDGSHQYFTRAIDFGFSKTLAEGLRFWPRDSMLVDVVRVIRRFRPQVVVSIFSGTPRDGHGQHQVAGVVARAAFDLLRDSTWGPKKFYRSAGFDTAGTTLVLATGALDPVAGRTYHQLAMEARSYNRSQEMGRLQDMGASRTRLSLLEDLTGAGNGGVFAGVDTALAPGLAHYQALVDSARDQLVPGDARRIVALLAAALTELRRAAPPAFLAEKEPLLEEALANAAGVVADAIADAGRVVPGQTFGVVAALWASAGEARLDSAVVDAPASWTVRAEGAAPAPVAGGFFSAEASGIAARRFAVTLPDDAPLSEPYFLARPPIGALYDWSGTPDSVKGRAVRAAAGLRAPGHDHRRGAGDAAARGHLALRRSHDRRGPPAAVRRPRGRGRGVARGDGVADRLARGAGGHGHADQRPPRAHQRRRATGGPRRMAGAAVAVLRLERRGHAQELHLRAARAGGSPAGRGPDPRGSGRGRPELRPRDGGGGLPAHPPRGLRAPRRRSRWRWRTSSCRRSPAWGTSAAPPTPCPRRSRRSACPSSS